MRTIAGFHLNHARSRNSHLGARWQVRIALRQAQRRAERAARTAEADQVLADAPALATIRQEFDHAAYRQALEQIATHGAANAAGRRAIGIVMATQLRTARQLVALDRLISDKRKAN